MDLISKKKEASNSLLIVTLILVLGIIAVNTTGLKSEVEDSENINISDIEDLINPFAMVYLITTLRSFHMMKLKLLM